MPDPAGDLAVGGGLAVGDRASCSHTARSKAPPRGASARSNTRRSPAKYSSSCVMAAAKGSEASVVSGGRRCRPGSWMAVSPCSSPTSSRSPSGVGWRWWYMLGKRGPAAIRETRSHRADGARAQVEEQQRAGQRGEGQDHRVGDHVAQHQQRAAVRGGGKRPDGQRQPRRRPPRPAGLPPARCPAPATTGPAPARRCGAAPPPGPAPPPPPTGWPRTSARQGRCRARSGRSRPAARPASRAAPCRSARAARRRRARASRPRAAPRRGWPGARRRRARR